MLQIAATVLLGLAGLGCALHLAATVRLSRFLRPRRTPGKVRPPITFWRALKAGVPGLAEKLDALAAASRPDDQLLIGISAGSPEEAVCAEWRARNPDRAITIVACEGARARNPKISKFCQMRRQARHEHWLLTDSEVFLTSEQVEGLWSDWNESGAAVLTAGYRFTRMQSAAQWLDVLPAAITLWPGLMLVPRISFTLGACTGIRAADVDAIGGWEILSDELAEDHELGARIVAAGREIALSHTILDLEADDLTFRSYFRHQHRLAVTYRAANPAGFAGLPIFHVVPMAALALVLHPGVWPLVVLCIVARVVIGEAEVALAGTRGRSTIMPFILLTLLMEGSFWLLAWLPRPVWWAGRWRRITWRGRLV